MTESLQLVLRFASRPEASNDLRSNVERQPDRKYRAESAPTRGKIEFAITKLRGEKANASDRHHHKLDLPRFGGRVVESIYSGVRMVLLCFTLGFSAPVFCITGTRSPVCRASGRSFSV